MEEEIIETIYQFETKGFLSDYDMMSYNFDDCGYVYTSLRGRCVNGRSYCFTEKDNVLDIDEYAYMPRLHYDRSYISMKYTLCERAKELKEKLNKIHSLSGAVYNGDDADICWSANE